MSRFNERYEAIVLKDVMDPKYRRNERVVWATFLGLATVLLVLYVVYFHNSLGRNLAFIRKYYEMSLTTPDTNFRTAVFIYNYVIAFALFLGVAAFCACLALMAFDMQRRNRIIQKLLERGDLAPASKE